MPVVRSWLSAVGGLLACATLAQATVADDLCAPAANPCVVNTAVTLAAGSLVDLGTRALHVGAQGRLLLAGGVTIEAGPVRLLPGARILGTGGDFGPSLTIHSTGPITVEVAGSARARVDVSAALAAGAIVLAAAGNVTIDGDLITNGAGQEGSGGHIDVDAGGDIGVTGFLEAKGGTDADGGLIHLRASGNLDAAQVLSAAGGDFGGGSIELEAGGDIVTRQKLDVPGGGISGYGGFVGLDAGGSVTVLGVINGPGVGDPDEGGGSGADVDIRAQQAVTLSAVVTITGALPDGEGGAMTLEAGTNVTQTAAIIATGNGIDGCGGSVDVDAGRDIRLDRIDLGGGSCGGGSLWARGLGSVAVAGLITADGGTQFGTGGFLTLEGRDVVTSAVVRANGGASGLAGTVTVSGCRVTVGATSELRTLGPNGLNEIAAGGRVTVSGKMTTSVGGANTIRFRDATLPPILTGVLSPVAVPVLDPLLPPCAPDGAACGNGTTEPGEECDDANNVACDGCAASCRIETCGNARVECDEECDVGAQNGAPGSPCDATCAVVPVEGGIQRLAGGTGRTACYAEWTVRNPDGEVVDGAPSHTQRCIDGDPACDQDGASDGECRFEVGVCLGATDVRVPSCQPAAIESVSVNAPNPLLVTAPHDVANASALVAALAATGVTVRAGTNVLVAGAPVTQRDTCTTPVAIRVPHPPGLAGTTQLLAAAREIDGGRMRRNRVDLVCDPNTAVCGNGVPEIGEGCDDGNTNACDGCNASCRPETCGDGVVTCGEQCDEGAANGTPDSRCSATCTEVVPGIRIPGGGSRLTDCHLETALFLGTPVVDGKGLPSTKQTCTDGDPTCDRDPAPGRCGFAMWVCVAGDDPRIGCTAERVAALEVRRPSPRDIGTLAAIRAALLQGVGAFVPTGPGEVCSGRMLLGVPTGKSWTKLQLRTRDAAGRSDTDNLKLRCLAPR